MGRRGRGTGHGIRNIERGSDVPGMGKLSEKERVNNYEGEILRPAAWDCGVVEPPS